MNCLNKLSKDISKIIEIFIAIILLVMLILVIMQVLFRYILNLPLAWTEEMARFLMTWLVFFGASVATMKGEHLAITILKEKIPNIPNLILSIVIDLIICIFLIYVVKYGFDLVMQIRNTKSTALQISMSIPYISIPVGGILLLIQTGINMLKEAEELKNCIPK